MIGGTRVIGMPLEAYSKALEFTQRYFRLTKKERKAREKIVRVIHKETKRLGISWEECITLRQAMIELWDKHMEQSHQMIMEEISEEEARATVERMTKEQAT